MGGAHFNIGMLDARHKMLEHITRETFGVHYPRSAAYKLCITVVIVPLPCCQHRGYAPAVELQWIAIETVSYLGIVTSKSPPSMLLHNIHPKGTRNVSHQQTPNTQHERRRARTNAPANTLAISRTHPKVRRKRT
jgi:hypothetical protein